jgi:hypothetical protein
MKPTKILKVWNFETGYVKKYVLMSGIDTIREISRDEVNSFNLPIENRYN